MICSDLRSSAVFRQTHFHPRLLFTEDIVIALMNSRHVHVSLCVCCAKQGELSDTVEEEVEVEVSPSVPSLPLATLLYSPSGTFAAEIADVSPMSMAIARHMGVNLTPDGIAARNRRGIALIVHGAPLSGTCSLSLSLSLSVYLSLYILVFVLMVPECLRSCSWA